MTITEEQLAHLAPRLRDLGDRKLYSIEAPTLYPDLDLLMAGGDDYY